MNYMLVGFAESKAELTFIGKFKGQEVKRVLLSNRCVEEGKQYAISFLEFEIVGEAIVADVIKMKEVGEE